VRGGHERVDVLVERGRHEGGAAGLLELVEAGADLLFPLLGHEEEASLELDRGEASLAGHGENEEQPASTRLLPPAVGLGARRRHLA
jgi:hypothetical protein